MERLIVFLGSLLVTSSAFATWSIVAVDRATGVAVIASATCVAQERFATFPADGLADIQAIVVPGKGIAAAQAGVDRTRANQSLIAEELRRGTEPEDILSKLRHDPEFERRQFGIVDIEGRRGGHSGSENRPVALDVQGEVSDTEIVYSIQGNILASDDVVHDAVAAFEDEPGSLSDRAMAAMEAADAAGGDRRCTCETEPLIAAPCDGKTAHVAYILEAGADTSEGEHTLYIDVTDENIEPHENANPVKTLRMRYDARSR
jgi:uncharacterized Ntn-hydrolase superfamily protein